MIKIILVLIGLQLAVSASDPPPVDLFNFCDDKADGYYCASCLQPVYCNSSAIPHTIELQTCGYAEACETFTTTLANCVDSSDATYCDCGYDSSFCDPYNEKYIVKCDTYYDYVYNITSCNAEGKEICRADTCVSTPSCSGVANGTWVRFYPVCYMGYECALEEFVTEETCEETEYLTDDGNCLPAPPAPCSNNCYGNCPDETDCSQYYFCDGLGNVLSGPYECPEYSYFNPNGSPPTCVEGDSSVCAPLTACEFYF